MADQLSEDAPLAADIGNVLVTDDACQNPYRYQGTFCIGDGRLSALRAFRDGGDTAGMQLWHAPAEGGVQRITAADVLWEGMRK